MQNQTISSFLQAVEDPFIKDSGVYLHVLRMDLMHPTMGGNKLFKLKYNLAEAKKQNKTTLLTFGGAFSNHISAVAAAGNEQGFKTIGIIRGEAPPEINPILKFAVDNGMQLQFISRELYRQKTAPEFIHSLNQQFQDYYLIPEGGANELGISGCKEIIQNIPVKFDHICCACGTGTTLAGIILSLKANETAIGFQVLNSNGYIKQEVKKWLNVFDQPDFVNWSVEENFHMGGYAKINQELVDFITHFKKETSIPLDLVYTGKMMAGIYALIKKKYFKRGSTVIAIHTGGIQGNAGYKNLQFN